MRDKLLALLRPEAAPDIKLSVVSMFFGKLLEAVEARLVSLEARQLQKGDKGDKGDRGEQGPPGPQGDPGVQGAVGPAGKDGKAGAKGKDGVSVKDAYIAADGHLVLKLSNGDEIDAGELPTGDGLNGVFVSGNRDQITVSATPPASPYVGQLWLDIS